MAASGYRSGTSGLPDGGAGSIDEVVEAAEKGTLQEAFGIGTAAIISPVGRFSCALTVVHNFGITRAAGTTAAERFFGQPHRDLFEHLLVSLPPPKRPAARRASAN